METFVAILNSLHVSYFLYLTSAIEKIEKSVKLKSAKVS